MSFFVEPFAFFSYCIAFARQVNHSGKSRLGHTDRRQQWPEVLRDSGLITCIHVDTESNIADILTKIPDKQACERLRDMVLWYVLLPILNHSAGE